MTQYLLSLLIKFSTLLFQILHLMHTRFLLVPPTYHFSPPLLPPFFFFNPSLPGSHFWASAEMPSPQRIYFLTVQHHPEILLGQPLSAAKAA